MSLPSKTLRRVQLPAGNICKQQQRNATLLQRPHIPYTFTQLIALTDGSTFTLRTTSPAPIFRATKDTRNHALWNPSLSSLRNQEQDEAGRLRAFREKFGRGWDIDAEDVEGGVEALEEGGVKEDSLMDLISGAAGVDLESAGASEVGSGSEGKSGKKGGDVVVEEEKKVPGKRADKGWGSK